MACIAAVPDAHAYAEEPNSSEARILSNVARFGLESRAYFGGEGQPSVAVNWTCTQAHLIFADCMKLASDGYEVQR